MEAEAVIGPSPRGQKRGAPDDDEAAGAGAARGSPRRADGVVDAVVEEDEQESSSMESVEEEDDESSMESVEEEEEELDEPGDDAPPARQLFDFLHVHPGPADADADGATAEPGSSTFTASQEPVDVTLRLGGPPVHDRGGAVDTTLSRQRLGEDGGGFRLHGEPVIGSAADNAAGRRPSTVLDLNKPCPSEFPDGAPGPSRVTDPAAAPVDVDERPAAEQRHRSRALFIDFFCSPAQDVRAPGVLTADSS
ncbi:hypothetical protein PVAP13_1KG187477 [Panicum virgatum]|uniref:Uncharacterized protein n=1 Tax=Panicum virgatum TaxID=38727 RepID=A0A8T0XAV6_PANVG|nr:hypothetical protein PVAP13_1KG187477 [Panicum virgatum]